MAVKKGEVKGEREVMEGGQVRLMKKVKEKN